MSCTWRLLEQNLEFYFFLLSLVQIIKYRFWKKKKSNIFQFLQPQELNTISGMYTQLMKESVYFFPTIHSSACTQFSSLSCRLAKTHRKNRISDDLFGRSGIRYSSDYSIEIETTIDLGICFFRSSI